MCLLALAIVSSTFAAPSSSCGPYENNFYEYRHFNPPFCFRAPFCPRCVPPLPVMWASFGWPPPRTSALSGSLDEIERRSLGEAAVRSLVSPTFTTWGTRHGEYYDYRGAGGSAPTSITLTVVVWRGSSLAQVVAVARSADHNTAGPNDRGEEETNGGYHCGCNQGPRAAGHHQWVSRA